jgi:hypothetical protein
VTPRLYAAFAINLLLGLCILWSLVRGSELASIAGRPAITFNIPEVPSQRPTQDGPLVALQDQNLFSASREFFLPPTTAPVPPHPDFRLVGTFMIPNKPGVALLAGPNGASRKVRVGDELEGWTVDAVEPKRVILRAGAATTEIASASGPTSPSTAQLASPGLRLAQANGTQLTTQVTAPSPSQSIRVLGNAQSTMLSTAKSPEPKLRARTYSAPPKK